MANIQIENSVDRQLCTQTEPFNCTFPHQCIQLDNMRIYKLNLDQLLPGYFLISKINKTLTGLSTNLAISD